jgi:hypothetical protein
MQAAARAETGLRCATLPLPTAFLHPAGKMPAEHWRHAPQLMGDAEPGFLPHQGLALALVVRVLRDLDHGDHRAVHLADQHPAIRRPRVNLPCLLLFKQALRMVFGGQPDRAHRHVDAVVFPQFVRDATERMVRAEVG